MCSLKNTNLEVSIFALSCVKSVVKETQDDKQKKYKTLCKKMNTLIQKNGLISTVVFVFSKQNSENSEIIKNIMEWSIECSKLKSISNKMSNDSPEKYIESITKLNNQEYRLLTKEMMILFGWIKRFADGLIGV